jgi:hypothetical protein
MVAEENYPGTKLGKRLKRLGVHQILIEGMKVETAANWSRGNRGVKFQKNVNGEDFDGEKYENWTSIGNDGVTSTGNGWLFR